MKLWTAKRTFLQAAHSAPSCRMSSHGQTPSPATQRGLPAAPQTGAESFAAAWDAALGKAAAPGLHRPTSKTPRCTATCGCIFASADTSERGRNPTFPRISGCSAVRPAGRADRGGEATGLFLIPAVCDRPGVTPGPGQSALVERVFRAFQREPHRHRAKAQIAPDTVEQIALVARRQIVEPGAEDHEARRAGARPG